MYKSESETRFKFWMKVYEEQNFKMQLYRSYSEYSATAVTLIYNQDTPLLHCIAARLASTLHTQLP